MAERFLLVLVFSLVSANANANLCVDGESVLYHKANGKIKHRPFGGSEAQDDYYARQVAPFLKQGWRDLKHNDATPDEKALLERIDKFTIEATWALLAAQEVPLPRAGGRSVETQAKVSLLHTNFRQKPSTLPEMLGRR